VPFQYHARQTDVLQQFKKGDGKHFKLVLWIMGPDTKSGIGSEKALIMAFFYKRKKNIYVLRRAGCSLWWTG
jgi:hypothetical protein